MAFYLTVKEIRALLKKMHCPHCMIKVSYCGNKQAFCNQCESSWDLSEMTQWDTLPQFYRKDILAFLNLENYPLNAMQQPLNELSAKRMPENIREQIQDYMESEGAT